MRITASTLQRNTTPGASEGRSVVSVERDCSRECASPRRVISCGTPPYGRNYQLFTTYTTEAKPPAPSLRYKGRYPSLIGTRLQNARF
ncbi:unnamed protein product [Leptidea sinapis]|uniref:Uncharacterized protein n=1 Tax=Leptidea sinapis TaxID=189913 RepID=A0A5E4Q5M1_9NEOP|nr:unnamed protein product [Leptidea sinapis]